jgi:hypothetical protein
MKLVRADGICAKVIMQSGDYVHEKTGENPGGFYLHNGFAIFEADIPLSDAESRFILDVKIVGRYTDKGYRWRRFRPGKQGI